LRVAAEDADVEDDGKLADEELFVELVSFVLVPEAPRPLVEESAERLVVAGRESVVEAMCACTGLAG
jgi:hypothetical protein